MAVSLSVPVDKAHAALLTRGDRMACSDTALTENNRCSTSELPTQTTPLDAEESTPSTFDAQLNDALQFALDRSTTLIQYLAAVEAKASAAYHAASTESTLVAGLAQATMWNSEDEEKELHPLIVLTPGLVLGAAAAILGIGSLSRRADEA
jgi:hypothetical protein